MGGGWTDPTTLGDCPLVGARSCLFPHLSVMDNLTLSPVNILGLSGGSRRKRNGPSEEVGLEEKARPPELSGVERVPRQGSAMNPKIILFDEPTSALDPNWLKFWTSRRPCGLRHDDDDNLTR